MSKKENQELSTQYFVEIDGEQVPVSEEIYRSYKQPLWAEHKRKERSKRCQISNGRGGLKRCEENCSQCPHQKNGSVLSLDCFEETGYLPADPVAVDPQQILEDALLLEELLAAIAELDPINQRIIELLQNEMSEREIATAIGLSQKAINKPKAKIREELKRFKK
ncbi:DNA-directed RNA polymerase specialized sigma24 family protein [Clostridiales Family XIII bacterium PM5-7]